MDEQNVVTIRLEGADLELLHAGQAQGEAVGIRLAVDTFKEAMRAWKGEVEKMAPERKDEIAAFVASYEPMFRELITKADVRTMNGRYDMARAVAAGAGKPRGVVGLRQRASAVMMWAAKRLEGS